MSNGTDDWRDLKRALKALAGVARLAIVYYLARQKTVTVSELTERLHISQPLVSWHLRTLRRSGLIEMQRSGRQVYCSLNLQRFNACTQRLNHLVDPAIRLDGPPSGPMLVEADNGSED